MLVVESVKNDKESHEAKQWPQILAILIGCLPGVSSGFFLGWSSPFIVKILHDKETYDINGNQASYFTVLNNVGLTVFSLFFTFFKIADKIGRKPTLMLVSIPHLAAWLMKGLSRNLYVLYVARFTSGLGDALVFASLPTYIGEITTPSVRGTWGNCLLCSLFLGQFLMNVIGVYCDILETSLISSTVPVVFLILFSFMPESPYFYVMKGKYEKAKDALLWLRRTDVEDEFIALKDAVERQMSETGSWKDLLTIGSNREAITAAIFLRVSQVMAGVFVFAAYTQFLFDKAGGNVDSEVSSMIYTGFSFVLFSIASCFSDRVGRKKSYMLSMFLSSLMLMFEAIYFYIDENQPKISLEKVQWFPFTAMIMFLIFSSFGVSIIPTLMMGELFSTSIKSKAASFVTTIFGTLLFLINYIFYYINSYTGLYGPFLLFGCCSFLSAILTNRLVPETKGKSLEEIQLSMKRIDECECNKVMG